MNKQLMALALTAAAVIAAPAHATTVALAADGSWSEFDVDAGFGPTFGNAWIDNQVGGSLVGDGSRLDFTFTIAAGSVGTLTVVDGALAGDTFTITNFGNAIGTTSSVAVDSGDVVGSFDEALADAAFSRGAFTLGAGSYSISGTLLQSVFAPDPGVTSGGLRLSVSAVPEPANAALLLGGLAAVALLARRRQARKSVHPL